jgi:hypothetical protein
MLAFIKFAGQPTTFVTQKEDSLDLILVFDYPNFYKFKKINRKSNLFRFKISSNSDKFEASALRIN